MAKEMIREMSVRVMKLRVKVTHGCITESECRIPSRCMLKVAVAQTLLAMPGQKRKNHYVRVHDGQAWWTYEGRRYRAALPANARRNYIAFDKNLPVRPFVTKLDGLDVGPVIAANRARKDRINEMRRMQYAAGHRQKKYTLRERIAGTVEPAGRPPKGRSPKHTADAVAS